MERDRNGRQAYWRANLRLIAALLAVWATVSFGFSILGVERLNALRIGRLPLGFWFGQQGAIYVFVVLIFVYAWCMDRIDRRFEQRDDDARPPSEPGQDGPA